MTNNGLEGTCPLINKILGGQRRLMPIEVIRRLLHHVIPRRIKNRKTVATAIGTITNEECQNDAVILSHEQSNVLRRVRDSEQAKRMVITS